MNMNEVIALLRKRQGRRTQNELAKDIGVSPSYLSDVLLGHRKPAKAIFKYLDLEITYRRKR